MPGSDKPGPIRAPRSLAEAQRLCEHYAAAEALVAEIEAARDGQIAAANALADLQLAPVLVQRAAIAAKLEPWWAENSALITQGKRKSAELGGVVLGTRKGKAKLAVAGAVDGIVEQLRKVRGFARFVRVRYELDRGALLTALEGKQGARLIAMGLTREDGAESFYIERTAQAGTQAKIS